MKNGERAVWNSYECTLIAKTTVTQFSHSAIVKELKLYSDKSIANDSENSFFSGNWIQGIRTRHDAYEEFSNINSEFGNRVQKHGRAKQWIFKLAKSFEQKIWNWDH